MALSKDEALAIFRSWSSRSLQFPLEVMLQVEGLAAVHVMAESVDVSEDELKLWYGREAWGGGCVILPLQRARITETKPPDNPTSLHHPSVSNVVRWVELRFISSNENTGCLITEYKCSMTITGFYPLDIALQPKDS